MRMEVSKSEFIRARIQPDLKKEVEKVFNEIGVTTTQVITMLYKQIAREHAIPLSLRIPNDVTSKELKQTDDNIGLIECKNIDDLFGK
jgi:DNA-damage-inducible protein J